MPSSKDEELYPLNHGVAFPREESAQTHYPEVGIAGLDLKLKNKKFGSLYGVDYTLESDDQSGTIAQQSSLMGEYLALIMEVLCYGKLASVANMHTLIIWFRFLRPSRLTRRLIHGLPLFAAAEQQSHLAMAV